MGISALRGSLSVKHIGNIIRNFILEMLLFLLIGVLFHLFLHRPFHPLAFLTDPAILAAMITLLVLSAALEFGVPILRRWWLNR